MPATPPSPRAIQFALTGTTDGSGTPVIPGLTADMLAVTTQCIDPVTLALGDCAVSGCGTPVGAQRPDFITVSMPNGYIDAAAHSVHPDGPDPAAAQAVVAYGGGS